MPIKGGRQYIDSINRLHPDVRYRGVKITGDISKHEAFRGLMSSQAALYDMQCQADNRDTMTYPSPTSGELVGVSFLHPRTSEDLVKRRIGMSLWAKHHHGFLGRSPDYMNTALMAYYSAADVLAEANPAYAENLKQYYVYCRENDVTLSHAFLQPTAGRLSILNDSFEDCIGAKVHEITEEGMVVSGAFLLATQGVTSEEIFILPPPVPAYDDRGKGYTFGFAVPTNLPGITFVCRESYVTGDSMYDYPLSSRFEEMDTLVIFDHVVVPHHRIFLYGDYTVAKKFAAECKFHTHVSHQVLCRYIAKTEFFLGLVRHLENLNGPGSTPMYEQVSELAMVLEILKSLLVSAEASAACDRFGTLVPNWNPLMVATLYFPKIYPRMMEIVQTITSSKLIMTPSEQDFHSGLGSQLNQYLGLFNADGRDVVGVHRLAWEMSASSFAGRQVQYERFFFGGQSVGMERLYDAYADKEHLIDDIVQFLGLSLPDDTD